MNFAMSSPVAASAPAGAAFDIFIAERLVLAGDITFGHQRLQVRRKWLAEGRMLHPERREDMMLDIGVERLARGALHDVAGKAGAVVRVGRRRARRIDAVRHPALEQLVVRDLRLRAERDEVLDLLLKARRVRHEVEAR